MFYKIIDGQDKITKESKMLEEYSRVIENLAELDLIFADDGSVNFDATAILIERLGRAFPSFSEIAVYEFDYIQAQRNPAAPSIKTLGQTNYPSVNIGEEFVPYGVKKLFLLALMAELNGDNSKLLAEFPDYYEFAEKKINEWVTFGDKKLLFRINNWLSYFLGEECVLKNEINNQLETDKLRPEYLAVNNPLLFKEIGFIPLYKNHSKVYFLMVRNLKGSIAKNQLELLGGEDQEMFAKMLELFISKYQNKMLQIAQRRKAQNFSNNLELVLRRQYHDIQNKVAFISGRANLTRRKTAGEKLETAQKLVACQDAFDQIIKASEDLLGKLKAEDFLMEIHDQDKEILNVKKILIDVVDDFHNSGEFADTKITINNSILNLYLLESKNKIHSYFINVFTNSFKYFNLKEGGNKNIEVFFSYEPAGSIYSTKKLLTITIQDNGPGLSPERAAEITANINAGYTLFPDQRVIEQGLPSHGEGLHKATNFVRENGGEFLLTSLPEGGCATTIKIYVDTQEQINYQKQVTI